MSDKQLFLCSLSADELHAEVGEEVARDLRQRQQREVQEHIPS